MKQEPLFHRYPRRWLCSSCGRWLLQNKHCCPSLIHVSEQTNSLVNHIFLSGFGGWAANQTLARKQAHKPRVKMNRVCGGITTKALQWVEALNVKQRQEGFDLHQSRCSVTQQNRKSQTSLLDWVEESRWKNDSFTPILALCSVRRSEELCDSLPLWTRSCLSVQTPYKHSLWLSLSLLRPCFFYLVLSFLFCIDLLSGNTQRIKYASGLDVSAEHPFFFLYHNFQNKSPAPRKIQ